METEYTYDLDKILRGRGTQYHHHITNNFAMVTAIIWFLNSR